MAGKEFKNLAEYEGFVKTAIAPWSPDRRIVLAAAMAERWLPIYAVFSTSEGWGDPSVLRHSLDGVWNWLASDHSSPPNWSHISREVHEITPHMDDFDANEALCACVMVQYAIDCCSRKDNQMPALMGVLSGLEAVLPDILDDERIPARLWRQAAVRQEIQKQISLIEKVNAVVDVNYARKALEPFLADPQMTGELRPRPKHIPIGPTNEHAFEQYRQIILMDIKSAASGLDPRKYPEFATTLYLAAWMGRYGRRKQIISGEYGALLDQTAAKLLVAKNHARDLAESHRPDWDEAAREMIEMCYRNPHNNLDAAAPDRPHGYGPSLRRLWVEAELRGLSDQQAWDSVQAWALHQPEGWGRKSTESKKQASATAAVQQENLSRSLLWNTTGDPNIPWAGEVDGSLWQVRLNDFPDQIMYSLLVDGEEVGDFHEWPSTWKRE